MTQEKKLAQSRSPSGTFSRAFASRARSASDALALALAETMDAGPDYAKGKIARELREILAELTKAELSPANLSLLQGVEL
jgi:hypothetical protein